MLLESTQKQETEVLARWTYSKDEWRQYRRWQMGRRGWLYSFINWLRPVFRLHVPEVRIESNSVWTNQKHEPFQNERRRVRNVHISDAGRLNIMEISYEEGRLSKEIRIPIPKGKLREAIAVQDMIIDRSAGYE